MIDPTFSAGRHAFEEALDSAPDDWDLRRVYADLLEECGEAVMSLAQRYMADNRVHPVSPFPDGGGPYRGSFGWVTKNWGEQSRPPQNMVNYYRPSLLPQHLFDSMREAVWDTGLWKGYLSRRAAETAMADALEVAGG